MNQPEFVHLHLHSEFSIRDGLIRLKPLIAQTQAQGMTAVAVTDTCNLFGLVRFFKAALAARVKPIVGAELWVRHEVSDQPFPMVALCQNDSGYRNLIELISEGYLTGQSLGIPVVSVSRLCAKHEGLILLSGAQQGDIGHALLAGDALTAALRLQAWQAVFGDRFYLEVTRTGRPQEATYLTAVLPLAEQFQCPVVATNDVRFLKANEFMAHEARVCIHQGYTLEDPTRVREYSPQQYLRSPAEMAALFADIPEAITNTVMIAKRCNLKIKLGEVFLPRFPTPENVPEALYLRQLSETGLELRAKAISLLRKTAWEELKPSYQARLDLEIDVINNMGFAGYFLIVADFIQWSKANGIPVGPGRGSGAGSLVAYVLQITDLDPLQYDLLFERFLNPERVSMPDFDIDFCMDGRDRVIDYVAIRYGRDSVSQIITFGTMAAKAVVRDVGRVLGHPYGFVDQIAKLIPFELGITLEKAMDQEQELQTRYDQDSEVRGLIDLAKQLEGVVRNAGKHAGGVVIAPSKLTDFVPLYCEASGENLVTQFDKDDVESVGLIKFDFLGLRTLTIIDWALQTINKERAEKNEPPIDITVIPTDDKIAFELLKSCQTTAVFQLESRGMKDIIKRLQPDCFEEIIALVALFRPGPLQSGMVDDFIDRKHGRAPVVYPHAELEPILSPTYGVILYQEQVMQITQVLAGYTLGGADILRRAMGKKKPEEMAKQRSVFVDGAVARGIAEQTATSIFDLMEKFAGYGFNKSHSAAYALVAYQTLWLKAHYPAEFMAAVLSADLDNTDKIVIFIEECKRMGLTILPPHVNISELKFTVTPEKAIRYGLGAIKGVGEAALECVFEARKSGGDFKNLFEFCQRIAGRKVNRRVLEALIGAGALEGLGPHRAALFVSIEAALAQAEQIAKNNARGQSDLFATVLPLSTPEFINSPEWSEHQRLAREKEALGYYLTGHPFTLYKAEVKQFISQPLSQLKAARGKVATLAGVVSEVRRIMTKNGRRMAVLGIDDGIAKVEITLFSDMFDEHKHLLQVDQPIIVVGEVSDDKFSGGLRVTAQKIMTLEQARARQCKWISLRLGEANINPEYVARLQTQLQTYRPGPCAVKVVYQQANGDTEIRLGEQWKVVPSDACLHSLRDWLGAEAVELIY